MKAVGDPPKSGIVSFSLTRGEVTAAQEHADMEDYFVLLVTNVLSPSGWSVRLLPNPFSTQGRKMFRDLSDTRTMMIRLGE